MSSLTKQARALKIELKKDFGARESASRVDVVAAATAAGNFNVRVVACLRQSPYTPLYTRIHPYTLVYTPIHPYTPHTPHTPSPPV